MDNNTPFNDPIRDDPVKDDQITIFQLDGQPVRGRSVKLGAALNQAISAHYPDIVARLLGEAMLIGALIAQSLKFTGRLVVQCHGTNAGALSLLVADCTSGGDIRGYARWDAARLKEIMLDNRNPGAETLLGGGTFSMTIDQGPEMDQYQGLAEIKGAKLSDCAEHYFAQSEQIPTQIHIACGQLVTEAGSIWRGGAMMIQKIASDMARGDTQEAWNRAQSLFATLSDAELLDPELSDQRLLYRLFHEDGVRLIGHNPVQARCSCSRERLGQTLKSFDKAALQDMADNGQITANCEFCGTDHIFDIEHLA